MEYYNHYCTAMAEAMAHLEVRNGDGQSLSPEEGVHRWVLLSGEVKHRGGWHYFAGNGASAMMSSHMSVDCTKNAGLPSLALNDTAYLTAIGNDLGYENTFSFPLERYGKAGDLLITISSSGNSPNIIKAIEQARAHSMDVVTLSGMMPDNQSRTRGDLNFYIPAKTYGIVECSHQILLHCWLDQYMGIREWEAAASS